MQNGRKCIIKSTMVEKQDAQESVNGLVCPAFFFLSNIGGSSILHRSRISPYVIYTVCWTLSNGESLKKKKLA